MASSGELNHSLPGWQWRKAKWFIHLLLLVNARTKHFSMTGMSLCQVFIILRHWHSYYSGSLHWFNTEFCLLDLKSAITKRLESDLSAYEPGFLFKRLIFFKEKLLLKKGRSKATDLFEELIPNNDVRSVFLLYRSITELQPFLIRLHYCILQRLKWKCKSWDWVVINCSCAG